MKSPTQGTPPSRRKGTPRRQAATDGAGWRDPLRLLTGGFAALALTLSASPALAETPPGWEPMTGPMLAPGETIPAATSVALAYGFIWLVVAVFVLLLWRRAARLERDLRDLEARLGRKGS